MEKEIENEIRIRLLKLVKEIEAIEGDNFIGAYLHGSLTMGCFNPKSSDIDLLVVVKVKLTKDQKNRVGGLIMSCQNDLPNKLEISVITVSTAQHIVYPPQYELSFPDEDGGYKMNGENVNLVIDFVIVKKFGVTIKGMNIDEVFSDVPDELYLKAIIKDFEWSFNNVILGEDEGKCKVPIYAVLNFCRALAFFKDRLIISKKEGGEWGIKNLPKIYKPIIKETLKEYADYGTSNLIDAKLLKDFAIYIRKELELNNSIGS